MNKLISTFVLLVLLVPVLTFSQEKIDMKKKWDLGINIGLIKNTSEVYVDPFSVSNDLNFQGSLSFLYWFNNELAFHTNIGFLASSVNEDISINGVEQHTSVVIPVHFGAKYSPDVLTISNNIRPFITGLIGVVTGKGTDNVSSYMEVTTNYYTAAAFSVKGGIGADALITKNFRFGLMLDYLYMADFDKAIGTRKNYSGIDLSFTFGLMM